MVVITRDEEPNLPRLLDSVRDVADEIIVFDSGSTDATVALAEAAGARVVSCAWKGWSATKNEANARRKGNGSSASMRMRPSPSGPGAILNRIAGPTQCRRGVACGEINRLTNYRALVRHSGWHPDRR